MIPHLLCDWHLVSHCIAQLENNKPVLDRINKVKDNPKEVAVILANHYLEWIESQRKNTNDEVYKMILNYVTMMNIYKNMVMAVRSGDSIMIERSYIDLLPIFEATTGKKNYVEIVCGMVETLYGTVEEKTLHQHATKSRCEHRW